MLYVFQVENGTMMTFEMSLALDTVYNLKLAIAQRTEIPFEKQVLLISGGESLSDMQRVCSYSSAGTDTSPIFLFVKVNLESNQRVPQIQHITSDLNDLDDRDMKEVIESCMTMQPSLDTLVARTELAAEMNQQATDQFEAARRLVHEQHLQQQAWSAVTANLEDLTRAFKNKTDVFMSTFDEFSKLKPRYIELLNKFDEDLRHLENTPILPTLLDTNKPTTLPLATSTISTTAKTSRNSDKQNVSISTKSPCHNNKNVEETSQQQQQQQQQEITPEKSPGKKSDKVSDQSLDEGKDTSEEFQDASSKIDEEHESSKNLDEIEDEDDNKAQNSDSNNDDHQDPSKESTTSNQSSEEPLMNLRQWIESHDNQNALKNLIELCWRGLERFSDENVKQIRHEIHELIKTANNPEMMKIGPVGARLHLMDTLMVDVRQAVERQSEHAASFNNHRHSFSKAKDVTVLPDLSESHKVQLQLMLDNHEKVRDYRIKCYNSKLELCSNLMVRLRWIIFVEQRIGDLDDRLMMYKENLVRLERRLQIVEQVHKAPDLYLESVSEALRRRKFSLKYLHWANKVAKFTNEMYTKELETRQAFDAKLGDHFLSNLFPGLTRSYPPVFANQAPDPFDTYLPRVTQADLQFLQNKLSDELAQKLQIPNEVLIPQIIYNRNIDNEFGNEDSESDLASPNVVGDEIEPSSQNTVAVENSAN